MNLDLPYTIMSSMFFMYIQKYKQFMISEPCFWLFDFATFASDL